MKVFFLSSVSFHSVITTNKFYLPVFDFNCHFLFSFILLFVLEKLANRRSLVDEINNAANPVR